MNLEEILETICDKVRGIDRRIHSQFNMGGISVKDIKSHDKDMEELTRAISILTIQNNNDMELQRKIDNLKKEILSTILKDIKTFRNFIKKYNPFKGK